MSERPGIEGEPESGAETWRAIAVLRRMAADRAAGVLGTLEDYLALFPDSRRAVEEEYARLVGTGGEAAPPPRRIGRYRLVEELGSGGQGVVHHAEDTRDGRDVALKVLRAPFRGPEAMRRLQREGRITARLAHPHLCSVLEAGEVDGEAYLAMPLVAGVPLQRLLAEARDRAARAGREHGWPAIPRPESDSGSGRHRDLDALLRFLELAARAVHAAHEAGVVHRDLKPGNLMVTPEGEPVVLDFGLARDDEHVSGTLTLSGKLLGTPGYMAPEQLDGSAHAIDRRVDVWALGVVLYECLTLRSPFDAPTQAGIVERIRDTEPLDPCRLHPRVPRDLGIVTLQALTKDPDRRYATALDLAEELARVRAGGAVLARRPGPWRRLVDWSRREPALARAFAVIAVLVVVAFVVLLRTSMEQHRLREAADEQSRRAAELATRAEAERQAADRGFAAVRGIVRELLREFEESVVHLPGATAAKERIVREGLDYLQLLDARPGARADAEIVEAHLGVGDLLGRPSMQNLGNPGEALAHYRQAATLAAELVARADTGDARRAAGLLEAISLQRIGEVEIERGEVATGRADLRRAGAWLDGLAAPLASTELALRRDVERGLAVGAGRAASPADVRQHLAAARQVVAELRTRHPERVRFALDDVELLGELADLELGAGAPVAARVALEEAGTLLRRLPPSGAFTGRRMAATVDLALRLGAWQRQHGDPAVALPGLAEAETVAELLTRLDPLDAHAQGLLLETRIARGRAFALLHRRIEARAVLSNAHRQAGRLRRLEPGVGAPARRLVFAYLEVARLLRDLGHRAEADELVEQARQGGEELLAADANNPLHVELHARSVLAHVDALAREPASAAAAADTDLVSLQGRLAAHAAELPRTLRIRATLVQGRTAARARRPDAARDHLAAAWSMLDQADPPGLWAEVRAEQARLAEQIADPEAALPLWADVLARVEALEGPGAVRERLVARMAIARCRWQLEGEDAAREAVTPVLDATRALLAAPRFDLGVLDVHLRAVALAAELELDYGDPVVAKRLCREAIGRLEDLEVTDLVLLDGRGALAGPARRCHVPTALLDAGR